MCRVCVMLHHSNFCEKINFTLIFGSKNQFLNHGQKMFFLAQCAILIFFSTLKAHIPCLFITLNDFAFVLSIFVHV